MKVGFRSEMGLALQIFPPTVFIGTLDNHETLHEDLVL